jgi:hypothetical protein
MRTTVALTAAAALAAAVGGRTGAAAPAATLLAGTVPTVPCGDAIGFVRSGRAGGYRVVLGIVSVPPARLTQVVPTHTRPWAYWRKAGLVIRASEHAVTVSVPPAWRRRAAIVWGNGTTTGSGPFGALRIAACPVPPPRLWRAYAGGFYLRSPSACVPVTFTSGGRSATVRFGIGRPCPA